MAKHEVVTPHTLEAAHKRVAALEADVKFLRAAGGTLTETVKLISDDVEQLHCACPEAQSLRDELTETKRQLLDAHKRLDRAEEFIKDFGDTLDAYRTH